MYVYILFIARVVAFSFVSFSNAGTVLHVYQLVIAAGGAMEGQVLIRCRWDSTAMPNGGRFVGAVATCDAEKYVELAPEPLVEWQNTMGLKSDCGSWALVEDHQMLGDILLHSLSKDISSCTVMSCDYAHIHGAMPRPPLGLPSDPRSSR